MIRPQMVGHIMFTELFILPEQVKVLTLTKDGVQFRGWTQEPESTRGYNGNHVDSMGKHMVFHIVKADNGLRRFAHQFVELYAKNWSYEVAANGIEIWRRP